MERALGIVLVRSGRTEHGHDRVPDELLDEAVVALDRSRQLPEQIGLKGADLLRIQGLGERGEPRQVREQDGDQPPVALGLAAAGRARAGRARGPAGRAAPSRVPLDEGRAAESFPPHFGQKAKSAWTVDPHPGQVIARPSLLHVVWSDPSNVAPRGAGRWRATRDGLPGDARACVQSDFTVSFIATSP